MCSSREGRVSVTEESTPQNQGSHKRGLLTFAAALVVFAGAAYGLYATNTWPFSATVTPVEQPAEQSETPEATAPEATKPAVPAAIQEEIYRQQYASAAAIGDLVGGNWASFDMGQVASNAGDATLKFTATTTTGTTVGGTLGFVKNGDTWYLTSVTRDGLVKAAPAVAVDSAVVTTIVEQQAQNQELMTQMLDGQFKKATIGSIEKGSNTATINVTLSGGPAGEKKAQIVCISTTSGATTQWFITKVSL